MCQHSTPPPPHDPSSTERRCRRGDALVPGGAAGLDGVRGVLEPEDEAQALALTKKTWRPDKTRSRERAKGKETGVEWLRVAPIYTPRESPKQVKIIYIYTYHTQ